MDAIKKGLVSYFKKVDIRTFAVTMGNTQIAERKLIGHIETLFRDLGVTYIKAGTQKPKDFRNINGTDLNVEVKILTSKFDIIFNDTLPCPDTEYLIFFTGKTYKKKYYPPQILLVNGQDFVEESKEWVREVIETLNKLKDLFCRGKNKKKLEGLMRCYFRPTWSSTILPFVNNPKFTVYSSSPVEV